MVFCIDFDGTVLSHEFPNLGNDIGALPVLKRIIASGHQIILFTMRSDKKNVVSNEKTIHPNAGSYLTDAVRWFVANRIPLYGINTNPTQSDWTDSPKAYAQCYIDDAALGCPLIYDQTISDRPFVDWKTVELMLEKRGLLW